MRSHDSSMCATARDHVSRKQFSHGRQSLLSWINSTTSDKLTFCRISLLKEYDLTKQPFFFHSTPAPKHSNVVCTNVI